MIRILYRHRSGTLIRDLPHTQLADAVRDSQARLWIDMVAPTDEELEQILTQVFRFHPLAIEDAVRDSHLPKVDDYGAYLYLVYHTFEMGEDRMEIDSLELDIFLGANYLISIHDHESSTINTLWDEDGQHQRRLGQGPAMLLYDLMDRQLDRYLPIFDAFEQRVEELGDLIFVSKLHDDTQLMDEILTAKTTALRMRRTLIPQLDVLEKLARVDYPAIPAESRRYFQDVYDHVMRLSSLAESMRDLVNSTATIHLTIANNRLNEIMKVLTIIATIFMPLSFIAGIYGMNFVHMPELNWPWMYPLVWMLFLAVAGSMLYFFRRRRWL